MRSEGLARQQASLGTSMEINFLSLKPRTFYVVGSKRGGYKDISHHVEIISSRDAIPASLPPSDPF